jgi:Putative adhesin
MSITEDAPAPPTARRSPLLRPGRARRASPWWWLVAVCAALLAVTAAVLSVWWVTSSRLREVSYDVRGPLSTLELDVDDADVVIVGGTAGPVHVQRTEEFAFGRPPERTRELSGDVLRLTSHCPDTVVGTCRVAYRVSVRDNVQLNVRTASGTVRVAGLKGSARIETQSGAIAVDGFCGFRLSAASRSGDVRGAADCSPDRLELRSGSGDVHAVVPVNRYRVDANSDRGTATVTDNLLVADDAPFAVQAISGSGDVTVEGRG